MKKNFDMTNYEIFSKRNNSNNYMSKDGKTMIKLFNLKTDDVVSDMTKELNITKKVVELGIKTPKCLDLVETQDGKVGLIYEYIANKKSLSRAVSEDFSLLDDYASIFANDIKLIHNTQCDTSYFPNIEDEIIEGINILPLDEENKEYLKEIMNNTPKTTTCLHGDCQMSNIIIAKGKSYAIDLGFFCYGNPYYDLGLWTVFANNLIQDGCCDIMFHMDLEHGMKMYNKSIETYFNTTDINEIEKIKNMLEPYGYLTLCKMLKTVVVQSGITNLNNAITKCRTK